MEIADIAGLEDERYAAVVAKDVAVLDRLLHSNLVYMHSSGVADTKNSYISGIRDGIWDYRKVDRSNQTIEVHSGFALVFNKLTIHIFVRDVERHLNNRALSVWTPENSSWRLVAMQSGPIPIP